MRVSQLWNWHGAMGRRDYFIWGTLLLALKFNLDRFLLDVGPDGRILNVTDYFHAGFPGSQWLTLEKLRDSGWVMLLPALPFLGIGVLLTMQRLRSARMPSSMLPLAASG